MYKFELATLYNISTRTLSRLMNCRYIKELEAIGYKVTDQQVSPIVVRRFFELYGEPLRKSDYES